MFDFYLAGYTAADEAWYTLTNEEAEELWKEFYADEAEEEGA